MALDLDELQRHCERLVDAERFSEIDDMLDETTLKSSARAALYHIKCMALDNLGASARTVQLYAHAGLLLAPRDPALLEYQYVSQVRLKHYAKAVATSALLCQLEPSSARHLFLHAEALQGANAHLDAQRVRAQAHLQSAYARLEQGEHRLALEDCAKAREMDETLAQARLLQAEIEFYMGERERATGTLAPLLRHEQLRIDALELSARIAEHGGDVHALETQCVAILDIDPHHAYAQRGLVKCAQRRADVPGVFNALDEVLRSYPADIWCHLTRTAYAQRLAGDEAFFLSVQNTEEPGRLIEVFVESGLYEAARAKLAGFASDERYGAWVERMAWRLWHFRQYAVMRGVLEDALQRLNAPPAALYGLLAAVLARDSVSQARAMLAKGALIDAHDPVLGYFEARILVSFWMCKRLRELPPDCLDALAQSLETWLSTHPRDGYALFCKAGVLYAREAYEEARRCIEQACEEGLSDASVMYWRARLAYACHDLETALDLFENTFEKRSAPASQTYEHFLLKADILSWMSDEQRLVNTLLDIKKRWPERIDTEHRKRVRAWFDTLVTRRQGAG